MSASSPADLPPLERGKVAIEAAKTGGFRDATPENLYRILRTGVELLRGRRIDFGGKDGTWEFFRTFVGLIVQRWQADAAFSARLADLRQRPSRVPLPTLESVFHVPVAAFDAIPPRNIGRIAGVVVAYLAPDFLEAVPRDYRPREEPGVGIDVEEFRRLLAEELKKAHPEPRPELRPGGGITFRAGEFLGEPVPPAPPAPEEILPEPPPTPEVEAEEVSRPSTAPIPENPQFPSAPTVSTYGRRELEAAWRLWTQLKARGVAPPPDVLAAAQRRWVQVFHFPPPGDFGSAPSAAPKGRPTPPPSTRSLETFPESEAPPPPPPLPPPTREYVEERIHVGPEGTHRELVRGIESVPVPSPEAPTITPEMFAGGLPQQLTEKYRPRRLDDVLGNRPIVLRLKSFAFNPDLIPSCMVFIGPPGLGKTTVAQAFARDYLRRLLERHNQAEYLDEAFKASYLEANAAQVRDDPGAFVLTRVLPYLKARGVFGGRKFLVFDDVNKFSEATQRSLLRPLEQFGRTTTIIWISNDPQQRLPGLESRCAGQTYPFQPIAAELIAGRLQQIALAEHFDFPNLGEVVMDVAREARGDVRAAIGILASRWADFLANRGG